MSLFGAMLSGVSALSAHTQSMAAISDNISNVNTIGYHNSVTRFQTLVTEAATATRYTPGGVRPAPLSLVEKQGLVQSSAAPTDIAIEGRGLFVVTKSASPQTTDARFFTRAGTFRADSNGNLINAGGFYLQGTPRNSSGVVSSTVATSVTGLQTVNIRTIASVASATTEVAFKANLKASQASTVFSAGYTVGGMSAGNTTPDFSRSVTIYDSLGTAHTLTYGFLKTTTANTWRIEAYVEPGSDLNTTVHATGTNAAGRLVANGTMVFNTDGSINTTCTTLSNIGGTAMAYNATSGAFDNCTVTWASTVGAANSTIAFDFGTNGSTNGITQFDGASALFQTTIDGALYGSLAGVEISKDGVVTALFDNGIRRDIYRVPIADFPNPNGLSTATGNVYLQSAESGSYTLKTATQSGSGAVISSALESSTVDLAEEFSTMIVTQRAYSASTRIITTTDEMLNELVNIKR
ncbi:MAG: flagellar hook protein FlgE [Alphaproteobacteria bacterium]|nr:flagellar hook protein FlgE [Alphaproteobacteria bacterium]